MTSLPAARYPSDRSLGYVFAVDRSGSADPVADLRTGLGRSYAPDQYPGGRYQR